MRKILILLFLMIISAQMISAQIRHAKGLQAIEVSGLKSMYENSTVNTLGIGYSKFFNGGFYGKLNLHMEQGKDDLRNFEFSGYGLDVTTNFTIFSVGNSLFFNIGAGLFGGLYSIKDAPETIKTSSKFNFGPILGPEIEIYLSDSIVILLQGYGKYMIQEEFGDLKNYAGFGLKYTF